MLLESPPYAPQPNWCLCVCACLPIPSMEQPPSHGQGQMWGKGFVIPWAFLALVTDTIISLRALQPQSCAQWLEQVIGSIQRPENQTTDLAV